MLSVSSKNLCDKSSTSSSTSASTIGNNGNLLIDILYCLPVKSLCVFKTVSKQWLTLISDPCFERNYHIRSGRLFTPALFMKKKPMTKLDFIEPDFETLVMDERNGIDYVPFKTPIVVKDGWHLIFEQSCHGLVLCTIRVGGRRRYVVYNPSTRQCKTLPSPQFRITGVPHVMSVSIAFDPAKSSYHEAVYVCRTDNSEGMLHIEIYSPKTDSWRDAGEPFPFSKSGKLLISGVYWNGSVHWIDEWTGTLHYFDIDCELMKNIALPTEPNHNEDSRRRIVYFNECRGHIHLVETRKDDMPGFDIWELRSDYTGWNLNYYVDLSPLITVYPGIVNDRTVSRLIPRLNLRVLLVEEGQDSSSRLILSITNDKVISFYLKSKCFKEMYDVKPDVWVQGFEYIETLAHA